MALLAQTDNPILWQESTHQERTAPTWNRRGHIVAILLGAVTIAAVIWVWYSSNGYPAMQLALYVVWLAQAAVAWRAIIAGANAVSREHVGQTWDALVLTGVSDRRILLGKWRAALHSVRGWMLFLGTLRLAMLPIFCLGIVKTFASYFIQYNYSSSYYYLGEEMSGPLFQWVPWAWFLAVIVAVIFTSLDVMLCTALGLAASAVTRRGVLAAVVAICIRFFPVITFAGFVRYQLGNTYFWRWWGRTEFSLSDAGTSAMMVLALPRMPWTQNDHQEVLLGLGLALLMLALLLGLSLGAAWLAIRFTGALPHPRQR